MHLSTQTTTEVRVDLRGLVQFLTHFDRSPNPLTHMLLYSAPFLAEPASWYVTGLLYAWIDSPDSCWFLTPPLMRHQALVITTRVAGRWHIVPVPSVQPGVEAVTQDILLTISQQHPLRSFESILVHEVAANEQGQYGRFLVEQGIQHWYIGLYEDEDGPEYRILSGGGYVPTF